MILDMAQSMALLILSFVSVLVLLGILVVVHKQTSRVKELEMRMKAMEKMDAPDKSVQTTDNDTK